MEQQQSKQNGGGNGFLFGLIVGVAIALLFTTKKGRAILRDLSEKVIDKLSKLEQVAKQSQEEVDLLEDFAEEEDYVKTEPQPTVKEEKKEVASEEPEKPVVKESKPESAPSPEVSKKEKEADEKQESEEEPQVKAPTKVIQGRRWFRGLKRRG